MDAFAVNIDHENMVVTITASSALPGTVKTSAQLNLMLRDNNVFKGIDKDEIAKAFSELAELKKKKKYIVARGKEPVQGKDGSLHFHVNVSGKTEYKGEEVAGSNDGIDYRNATVIQTVKKGDLILTITKPTMGDDGYTLTGKVLNARTGKMPALRLGDSVLLNKEGTKVYAGCAGQPVFSHRVLSVSSVYDVLGDVCYETGNIFFNGHVNISGGVLDDFTVEANSIEIRGAVGAATVKCKGDLVILGGINGHAKATIVCGGNADIKYINAADVEVKKDLRVQKEIINSVIKANGSVSAAKVVGGHIMGLKGLDIRVAGAEIGTPTILEPGVNYEVRRIENAMRVLSRQIEGLLKPFKPYVGDRDYFVKAEKDKKELITARFEYFKKIKTAYLKLLKGRELFQKNEKYAPVNEVSIFKKLYHDVSIKTALCSKQYLKEVSGPIRFVEDISTGSIKTKSYKDLDESEKKAGDEKNE